METMENKLKISETLQIGVDIGNPGDISVLQVSRCTGNKIEIINTMHGEEAEWTYEHLLNNCHHIMHFDEFVNKLLDARWKKANPTICESSVPEYLRKTMNIPQKHEGTTVNQVIYDELASKEKE